MEISAPHPIQAKAKDNGRITYHPIMPDGTMVDVNHLMTLQEAVRLGYAASDATLQSRAQRGRLKAIKPGRDWLVTEAWLLDAGYTIKQ